MKIILSGASGLLGTALSSALRSRGDEILVLRRHSTGASPDSIPWDINREDGLDVGRLEGAEAVIHLAGENVASGRWTPERKARIRNSRVQGTSLLARSLAGLTKKPRVFLCASGTGYYGNRGPDWLDESAPRGAGFLARVCEDWEQAADPARSAGIRTLHLRFGMVLSGRGGALAKMLPVFRMGLGGPVGSGRQFISWISLEDLTRSIAFLIAAPALSGPVNVVAPNPVSNRDFSRALGRALHRPARLPVPGPVMKLLLGEMARELLLSSQRVRPGALLDAGFSWKSPEVGSALLQVLAENQ